MHATRFGSCSILPERRAPFPVPVRTALARRGAAPDRLPGEAPDAHRTRLETELMALFRDERGEQEFEALYAWCQPTVERAILGRLRGQPRQIEAGELVQDVFVNLYRYAGSFRDEHPASFRSWLSAIAGNVVRRKLAPRTRVSLESFPESLEEPADLRLGPVQDLQLDEERTELARSWCVLLHFYARAFRDLSPRDRQALQLIEVEGITYAEACERLKVGMSNMKMIMFRARRRIRARIRNAMAAAELATCLRAG